MFSTLSALNELIDEAMSMAMYSEQSKSHQHLCSEALLKALDVLRSTNFELISTDNEGKA